MPYVERTIIAGKTIEIDRFYTSRWHQQGIDRGERVKPTGEAQKKVNTRKAEQKLRVLLNSNFEDGDLHMNFGYIRRKGEPERTREQMKQDAAVFLRELRKVYKKAGHELKYVHVMEIGKKGARHHHMVINQPGIDTRLIQKAWNRAYPEGSMIHFAPLNTNGDYSKLAAYLIKYTDEHLGEEEALMSRRWNSSRNLVRPKPSYKVIKDRNQFSEDPKPRRGYVIVKDSVEVGIHSPEFFGFGYLHYRMVKLE